MARNEPVSDRRECATAQPLPRGARSVAHGEFHLERVYDSAVARVWQALTEPEAKAKWFTGRPGRCVPNERLVYCYQMFLDERKISVSLATLQLEPSGRGTRLKVAEQGAFLDGYDDCGSRERGTADLPDALGASLRS